MQHGRPGQCGLPDVAGDLRIQFAETDQDGQAALAGSALASKEARRMAAAKTRPFKIGADATCTDGVYGRATRGVRGLGAVDSAGARPGPGHAFGWPLTAAR